MKIFLEDYFGKKLDHVDATTQRQANAIVLLTHVNALLVEYADAGHRLENNPHTGTLISGSKGGDGGFRLASTTTGSPGSSHKEGQGIDIYDAGGLLNKYITRDMLVRHGLFRESPKVTPTWCHLQTRPTKGGNRTFNP